MIAEGTAEALKQRLGGTILEVRMGDPAAAERARAAAAAVAPGEVLDDGRTVALTVDDAGPALLAVVRALDAGGLTPERVSVREPTLDDVFLQLTGQRRTVDAPVATDDGGGRSPSRRRGAA